MGRRYLVPVIDFVYCGREGSWPTLGPLHHDKGDVGFEPLHFHIDVRFLTGRQAQAIRRYGFQTTTLEEVAAVYPLNRTDIEVPRRPRLEERRCRVSSWTYSPPSRPRWLDKFDKRYGKVAEPVRVKGGRLLCPHRKVDLSSFPPDENGVVTCPLHGLRVQCGVPA